MTLTKAQSAVPFITAALILVLAWGLRQSGWPEAAAIRPLLQLLLAFYCSLIGLLCGGYYASCVWQNSPANAMLVPGLRQRLMCRVALAWAMATIAIAAGVAIVYGGDQMPGAAILAGAVLGAWLIARRLQPALCLVVALAYISAPSTGLAGQVAQLGAMLGQPAWFAAGLLLDLLLLGAGLSISLPRAGDRHMAWHHRLRATVPLWQGNFASSAAGVRTTIPGLGYAGVLARDSRGVAANKMMMHSVGVSWPVVPMLMAVAQMLMAIATLPAVAGSVAILGRTGSVEGSQIFQGMIMTAAPMYAVSFWGALSSLRGEQGLYRMAPAAPAAARFNRVLAATLLGRYLQVWLLSVLCLLLVGWLAGDLARSAGALVLQALLALPFAGLLLRDYAALPALRNKLVPLLWIFFVSGFYIFSFAYVRALPGLDWLPPALLLAAATALVLRQRWQTMVRAAPAFPACRLS